MVPAAPVPALADPVALLVGTLRGMAAGFVTRLPYLAVGLSVVVVFYVAGRIVRRVAHTAGERTRLDVHLADVFGTLAVVVLTALGVLVAAVIIFPSFTPGALVQGLGVTSVAVGFAFKEILQNFFAGILILLRKPFVVGDQIRVHDFEGTVDEINTRSTRLTTYDGERVILPNGDVYTSSIVVRTAYPQRRVHVVVGVGYGDPLDRARDTILHTVRATDGVLADPAPAAYVDELAPSSVNFTVYFWASSQQADVLAVRDRVVTRIKDALDAAHIDMPYPHTVVAFAGGAPPAVPAPVPTPAPTPASPAPARA